MALTGLFLVAFIALHVAGNLQVFLGPQAINHYAEFAKSSPGLLWAARICLAAIALTHIAFAITLTLENRAKREIGYEVKQLVGASLASRTMFISGSIIFCFIVFHLLHFTTGTITPEFLTYRDARGSHDVYRMLRTAFSNGWVVLVYIIAVGALGLHLSNALRAICQSLGWRFETYASRIDRAAVVAAVVISLGFAIVPLTLFLGGAK